MLSIPTVDKGILMSRKDYELIARAFFEERVEVNRTFIDPVMAERAMRQLAHRLAHELHAENSRFDTVKFICACGF